MVCVRPWFLWFLGDVSRICWRDLFFVFKILFFPLSCFFSRQNFRIVIVVLYIQLSFLPSSSSSDSPTVWSHLDVSMFFFEKFILSSDIVFDVLFFFIDVLVCFRLCSRFQRYELLSDVSIGSDTVMYVSIWNLLVVGLIFDSEESFSFTLDCVTIIQSEFTNRKERNTGGVVYNLRLLSWTSLTFGDSGGKISIES